MKHTTLIITSILFGILFYNKSIGLNLAIFSLITTLFLVIHNFQKFTNNKIRLLTIVYLTTAVFVFIHNSSLSIIINLITLFTLVGTVAEDKTSIYIAWINGLYSSIAGTFHRNFEKTTEDKESSKINKTETLQRIKLFIIPALFITLFILLYKDGNPMFNDIISKIKFDFVDFPWILFCVLGYFFFSNIIKPFRVEPATSKDISLKNTLQNSDKYSEEILKKEKQLGATLLGFLNVLIIFYIVTDILFLLSNTIKTAPELSNQVHSGINTLIVSIIIAILVILYFFRGDLNFYSNNKPLKKLTYIWIVLNIILIILVATKNQNYISTFGLTYKRIGVHIYILLTFIGLITTLIKVAKIKNLLFLFRYNTKIAFIILLFLSTFNWDSIITKYNISTAKTFDLNYLIKLSKRNALTLYQYKTHLNLTSIEKNRIDQKHQDYIKKIENSSWQELSYESFKIKNEYSK